MARDIGVQPQDPAAARAEIERTRARMSETIDELENVLVQKKETLQRTLDVGARVREKPLQALGIVFGVGLVFGVFSGCRKESEDLKVGDEAEDRASIWETRARRLLAIARAQEEDLEELEDAIAEYEARLSRAAAVRPPRSLEENPSRWQEMKKRLGHSLSDYVSEAREGIGDRLRQKF